eukprot:Gregarina_sp_Poly_1__284@NODE_106_length_14132_cov_144_167721_g93_i0_p2_GENE_NODE_106_length_14132_cov_144_167721_g93_i0NODE_106_length_14132_cov_144_167721_g93_i0_p2_ORF_typecomplete_len1181_score151_58Flavi_glycop_C/PF02832_16/6_5Flavi_glycop_C/PF02832_16/3_2e02Flavi_glycop_C/PF02832_16/1_2e02Flavi_glycop_C/PF02832_16/38Flavi_glycop_C/PF02832_16/6_3e02CBM_35/PF16990_5/2_9CBM_35/PF16990_5/3_1e03CBM_35/PF16990_5/6_2e03PKD/PF00801_20/3e03PKD/PF00801_20/8_6e03PKD/PF00801_20/0_24PKD/PF00801_20/1_1e
MHVPELTHFAGPSMKFLSSGIALLWAQAAGFSSSRSSRQVKPHAVSSANPSLRVFVDSLEVTRDLPVTLSAVASTAADGTRDSLQVKWELLSGGDTAKLHSNKEPTTQLTLIREPTEKTNVSVKASLTDGTNVVSRTFNISALPNSESLKREGGVIEVQGTGGNSRASPGSPATGYELALSGDNPSVAKSGVENGILGRSNSSPPSFTVALSSEEPFFVQPAALWILATPSQTPQDPRFVWQLLSGEDVCRINAQNTPSIMITNFLAPAEATECVVQLTYSDSGRVATNQIRIPVVRSGASSPPAKNPDREIIVRLNSGRSEIRCGESTVIETANSHCISWWSTGYRWSLTKGAGTCRIDGAAVCAPTVRLVVARPPTQDVECEVNCQLHNGFIRTNGTITVIAKPNRGSVASQELSVSLEAEETEIGFNEARWIVALMNTEDTRNLRFTWSILEGGSVCRFHREIDAPSVQLTQYTRPSLDVPCKIAVDVSDDGKPPVRATTTIMAKSSAQANEQVHVVMETEASEMQQGQAMWVSASKTTGGTPETLEFSWELIEGSNVCSLSKHTNGPSIFIIQNGNPATNTRCTVRVMVTNGSTRGTGTASVMARPWSTETANNIIGGPLSVMLEAEDLEINKGQSRWVSGVKTTGGTAANFHYNWEVTQGTEFCRLHNNPNAPVVMLLQYARPSQDSPCVVRVTLTDGTEQAQDQIIVTARKSLELAPSSGAQALGAILEYEALEVTPGRLIWLSGLKSTGPGGVHYAWDLIEGDSYCRLSSNGDAPTTMLVQHSNPSSDAKCKVRLTVSDSDGSDSTKVTIVARHIAESKPPSRQVNLRVEEPTVRVHESRWIDASGSTGGNLTFAWELVAGSEFCSITQTGNVPATILVQNRLPLTDAPCTVRCSTTDLSGTTVFDEVSILASSTAPSPNAAGNMEVKLAVEAPEMSVGQSRWISAAETASLTGNPLQFAWSILSGDLYCRLTHAGDAPTTIAVQYLRPETDTPCVVQAIVADGSYTGSASIAVTMKSTPTESSHADSNRRPVVRLFVESDNISAGRTRWLSADGSYDPDGDPEKSVEITWRLDSGQEVASLSTLSGPRTELKQTAPVNSTTPIRVTCIVSDGETSNSKTAVFAATTHPRMPETTGSAIEVEPERNILGISDSSSSNVPFLLAASLVALSALA